ncbi:MAG: response regulator transcription factor [Leptolyngbya sp. SIO1D8]|nr:response regulator transcription factor [Leptolyngbya sp. SIO1D8]
MQKLKPDLLIMDLQTAEGLDLEPCRHLALTMKKTPIMLLGTASIQEQIDSLNVCANDYLSVPFSIEEFLARVRAKIRRVGWEKTNEVFVFQDLWLDIGAHELYRDDQKIELTAKEFDLLKYFMAYPQQVLTHQQILDTVWPDSRLTNNTNILHVYIRYLRRKLKSAGQLIQTVRGVGYMLKGSEVVAQKGEYYQ